MSYRLRRLAPTALLLTLAAVPAPPALAAPRPAPHVDTALATPGVAARLAANAKGLRPEVLARALAAVDAARAEGVTAKRPILTVIDYSLPSTEPRLWVLDLARGEVLYRELVAHGKGTGEAMARTFSNTEGTLASSLGLFRTADTYIGKNGYSLRLHGLEPGINDQALARTIVMHGAWYVSPEHARRYGRLGRSWGCPAVSDAVARPLIDTVKNGTFVFADYPDPTWLASSRFLRGSSVRVAGAPAG